MHSIKLLCPRSLAFLLVLSIEHACSKTLTLQHAFFFTRYGKCFKMHSKHASLLSFECQSMPRQNRLYQLVHGTCEHLYARHLP